ncbi:putative DNA repair protein Nse1 [Coniella lustricola]|uniref:Non-structural maintenance of chromosomes element 1 homolog n=1 Tax=Coniella lustricola TaxID=2025994 RepID=A0A2T3AKT5_9PEZI|nr:putative DNA repair protein Nse1 [Coniella lustricola]
MESQSDEPDLPAGWGNAQRAFLQALMGRGTLTAREAKSILAAIQGSGASARDITDDQVRQFISQAREAVAPLDYDIRSTVHQTTRQQVWALINAHSDPSTQLATSRNPEEIAFIKRLLDAMFDTCNTPRREIMAVTAAQARKVARPPAQPHRFNNNYNNNDNHNHNAGEDADGAARQKQTAAVPVDKGLKHSEVEKLLPSLVDEGWLELSDEGFYSLSPRALMELKPWLLETYNEPDATPEDWQRIKFCEACKDIITTGQRCPSLECNLRLHDMCTEAFWRTRRGGQKVCSKCQTEWNGAVFVGPRAVTAAAAASARQRTSGGGTSNADSSMMPEQVKGSDEEE